MYRVTLSGKSLPSSQKPSTRVRIYRWGNTWGMLQPGSDWERTWKAETRKTIGYGSTDTLQYLIESVTNGKEEAPPCEVDDMWEEEIIQDGVISYGNTVVLTGNGEDIRNAWKRLSLPMDLFSTFQSSVSPSSGQPSPPKASPQPPLPSSPLPPSGREPERPRKGHPVRYSKGPPVPLFVEDS